CLSSLLLRGRERLHDAKRLEPGALCGERNVPARGRVEDEKTDLVVGNMDRASAPDACPLLRQLLCGRAGPTLEGAALSRLVTSEICLDEVARHALDARRRLPRSLGGNPLTLLRRALQREAGRELGTRAKPELCVDSREVGFDGAIGDEEPARNL